MSCLEYKAGLIELARGEAGFEARRHAQSCGECALFLEQQLRLTVLEREIAADALPPAHLEAQLLREFAGVRARRSVTRIVWGAMGSIAAGLILTMLLRAPKQHQPPIAMIASPAPVAVVIPAKSEPRIRKRRQRQDTDPPFLPIPYTQPLAPGERAEIVRMQLPVAALIAAGFPIATSDAAALASADVIVGEDGRARAVRLISISERSIER